MTHKREIWVDDVKVIACMLVLLGHLMQGMVGANIVPDNALYRWFDTSIYYFHVPLFFICSGYLFQKFSKVNSMESWLKNVIKKLLALGIPYFTFTIATWLIKSVFSGAGSNEIDNIFDTLFLHPTAPYWYLYALFFIFLITPTFGGKKMAVGGLAAALLMKIVYISGIVPSSVGGGTPYFIIVILANEIWFVIGMCLSVFKINEKTFCKGAIGAAIGILFLILSVPAKDSDNSYISFALGLLACAAVVLLCWRREKQGKVMAFLSKYTMPIFLMHTIFAATLRSVLLKLGIDNAIIQIPFGIAIGIFGPVFAAWIMKKTKYLEFFIYPGKFIKIK